MQFLALLTPVFFAVQLAEVSAVTPTLHSIDAAHWNSLNRTVNGRLYSATPIALSCFSKFNNQTFEPDPQACAQVQSGYTSPEFRNAHYSAFMNPEWETCLSTNEKCLLDSANTSNPLALTGTSCSQGSVSPYYIDVRSASDVQAAFAFARRTKVPLSIKNTGHDYMGRSSLANSLALWTHNLNSMRYEPRFVPELCRTTRNAITIGAGVIFQDVYKFADDHNTTFVGGYAQTVGTSGGWLMGGGHSVLSPALGLGVDRVVQIKIVTPDGRLRVANECQNTDLFWALRGGGGGTFGVVLESTHIVEKRIPIQTASIKFTPSSTNLRQFYEILVNNSVKWGSEGWGGHVRNAGLIHVTPNLSLEQAKLSMKPVADYAASQNGTVVVEELPSWLAFFQKYVLQAEAPVGVPIVLGSRLIPKANFESVDGRAQLTSLLMTIASSGILPYIPVVNPVLFKAPAGSTSVTPAWRNSLWHMSTGTPWQYNTSVTDIKAIMSHLHNTAQSFRNIAPSSGSYMNEADIYEVDHTASWWGNNYPRLLQIKKKYDPQSLLDCWKCVGSNGNSKFSCYLPSP